MLWSSNGQDGFNDGVFGQRFEAGGAHAGPEFQINDHTANSQGYPAAAWNHDGTLVVVGRATTRTATAAAASSARCIAVRGSGPAAGDGDGDGDRRQRRRQLPHRPQPRSGGRAGRRLRRRLRSPDVLLPPTSALGRNPIIGRGTTIQAGVPIGDDSTIGEYVRLERQAPAMDRLRAEDYVAIGRSSRLGNDVALGFATRLEGPVSIGNGVSIADQVIVRRNVVIGDEVEIDALVVLYAGARIGNGATIEMGARIGRGATVSPGAVVPAGTTVSLGGRSRDHSHRPRRDSPSAYVPLLPS